VIPLAWLSDLLDSLDKGTELSGPAA